MRKLLRTNVALNPRVEICMCPSRMCSGRDPETRCNLVRWRELHVWRAQLLPQHQCPGLPALVRAVYLLFLAPTQASHLPPHYLGPENRVTITRESPHSIYLECARSSPRRRTALFYVPGSRRRACTSRSRACIVLLSILKQVQKCS